MAPPAKRKRSSLPEALVIRYNCRQFFAVPIINIICGWFYSDFRCSRKKTVIQPGFLCEISRKTVSNRGGSGLEGLGQEKREGEGGAPDGTGETGGGALPGQEKSGG